jgi:anti-anti-sigma factor
MNSSDGDVVVRLVGDLDASTAPWLLDRLWSSPPAGSAVFLDLSGVSFLDVSGARAVARIVDAARLAQVEIRVEGLRGSPLRTARMVGLDQIVEIDRPDEQ